MTIGMTYCSAFQEDDTFGAIIDSFLYRWTNSCIANSEYEPEDMLKTVLHALASLLRVYGQPISCSPDPTDMG